MERFDGVKKGEEEVLWVEMRVGESGEREQEQNKLSEWKKSREKWRNNRDGDFENEIQANSGGLQASIDCSFSAATERFTRFHLNKARQDLTISVGFRQLRYLFPSVIGIEPSIDS